MSAIPRITAEFIWMAKAPHVQAPLEALTHILAAAIARQFGEPTSVFASNHDPNDMLVWRNDTLDNPQLPLLPQHFANEQALTAKLEAEHVGSSTKHCALFVNPDDPNTLPPRYKGLRFHRIVYVTDGLPSAIPPDLQALLHAAFSTPPNLASNPPFGAFIPTIRIGDGAGFRSYAAALGTECLTLGAAVQDFRTRALDDDLKEPSTAPVSPVEDKLHRDLCRVQFDFGAIEQRWNAWSGGGVAQVTPFIDEVPDQNTFESTSSRWAAAVTNRQTGVALSGGGASAYRFGPLLERLRDRKVPIHVLGGVSGGALIGAYCAAHPATGFAQVKDRGLLLWLAMPVATLSTIPLEAVVNWDLDGARVEELETRFVAVTAKLPENAPPEASAVVRGTVGEAVRASGTLPPTYAPTKKNGVRYTDGAAAAIIPAHALRDYGADVVLAMNCICGPERTNHFGLLPFGSFLYNYWDPFSRVVDHWAWNALHMQRSSRRFGRPADVYVEFEPVTVTFLECTEFLWPSVIEARAVQGGNGAKLDKAADELLLLWSNLG